MVTTEEQRDPGPRPDAADADDLAGEVRQLELLEQLAPVVLERRAVDPHQLAQPFEPVRRLRVVLEQSTRSGTISGDSSTISARAVDPLVRASRTPTCCPCVRAFASVASVRFTCWRVN